MSSSVCSRSQAEALRPYHLENPLWVFVGSTVNAVYTKDKQKRSDVLTVARFLHHVLENKHGWAVRTIKKLIEGKTGLVTPDGQDVFEGKFKYLYESGLSPEKAYQDILVNVLHAPVSGGLHLCDIRGSAGEIGLKASSAEDYFGLIYIGDTSTFKKLVEEDDSGITLEEDAISGSLFDGISEPNTSIDVLIGANYMSQFRAYLEKEGVETEGYVELPLFIRPEKSFLEKGLVVPRVPEYRNFEAETDILLEPDTAVHVHVDITMKVQALESGSEGVTVVDVLAGREQPIPAESLDLVDWEKSYFDLLEYKERKGLTNLVVRPDAPRKILATNEPEKLYSLVVDESVVRPESFAGTALLQDVIANILRKYVDAFYRVNRERWDSNHMVYRTLDESDPNLSFNRGYIRERESSRYVVNIQRSESKLVSAVGKLIDEVDRLFTGETGELPRIHFDRHLYQPLLVDHGDKVRMTPPGLNKSESQFVRDIKEFWALEKDKSLAKVEVFLLRNLGLGIGIGFFEERGFYPDFILWIMEGKKQHIVFVEPHGMIYANAYIYDDKARLHEALRNLAKGMGARSKRKDITLDSYIISATSYEDLRKKYDDGTWDRKRFADAHILFLERNREYDYMERIFAEQLTKACT